jgi:putative ABC transport system substrate-binding protein
MVASPRRSRGWRVHALTALITTSVLGMAGAPAVCGAQTSSRVFRVAFLGNGTATLSKPSEDALRAGLRDLGYIEGANLVIASRYADGSFEQLPRLSRELVDMKPDVLVSAGPQALRALRETTSTLPIVSAAVSDPVEEGLVASLARPGGNITGMAFQNLDLTAKRLELLKETVPDARKIAVLSDATLGRPGGARQAEAAAERLGSRSRSSRYAGAANWTRPFARHVRRAPRVSWCSPRRCSTRTGTPSSPTPRARVCPPRASSACSCATAG